MKKTFSLTLVFALSIASIQSADCKDGKTTYTVEKSIDVMQSQTGWSRTAPTKLASETFTYSTKKDADEAMKTALQLNQRPSEKQKGVVFRKPGDLLRPQVSTTKENSGASPAPVTSLGTDEIRTAGRAPKQTSAPHNAVSSSRPAVVVPRTDYHGGYHHSPAQGRPVPQQVRELRTQTATTAKKSARTTPASSSYAATYGTYDGKPKKRNY